MRDRGVRLLEAILCLHLLAQMLLHGNRLCMARTSERERKRESVCVCEREFFIGNLLFRNHFLRLHLLAQMLLPGNRLRMARNQGTKLSAVRESYGRLAKFSNYYKGTVEGPHTRGTSLGGYHEGRTSSKDTYPESYITKYTSKRRLRDACRPRVL